MIARADALALTQILCASTGLLHADAPAILVCLAIGRVADPQSGQLEHRFTSASTELFLAPSYDRTESLDDRLLRSLQAAPAPQMARAALDDHPSPAPYVLAWALCSPVMPDGRLTEAVDLDGQQYWIRSTDGVVFGGQVNPSQVSSSIFVPALARLLGVAPPQPPTGEGSRR